jgi:ubiquinol-cytochrome c reductase cytochrome c1 subunit
MNRIAYRNFVDQGFTEDEMKEIAASRDATSLPDEKGKVKLRPATLPDYIQSPYLNENEARYNNNGAYPPDLSLMAKGRERGEDYIFSLLTGYCEPPENVEVNISFKILVETRTSLQCVF